MTRILVLLVLSLSPWAAPSAALCPSSRSPDLDKALQLQAFAADGQGAVWQSNPASAASLDAQLSHDGAPALRIEQAPNRPATYSIRACAQMDFAGKTIELHGFLRTQDVTGRAGLWLDIDGDGEQLAYDNMQDKNLQGTTDWQEFSVTLPRDAAGREIFFGAYLRGSGKLWVSGLRLLVDGKPVEEAPAVELPETPLNMDQEFDQGSHVSISILSRTQVANLVILGKVWGFLKYYHPEVKAGHRHWDYDLFRILPAVLAAPERATADAVLARWIGTLGPVPTCKTCAHPDLKGMQLKPDLSWIADEKRLGHGLSRKLRWIRDNDAGGNQFYLAQDDESKYPIFKHELRYPTPAYPDAGFRLLALYRYWNMVEYWYPYRDIIGDWDRVLADSIPKFAAAKDQDDYVLQLMALIADIHDTHAGLRSLDTRPPTGECHLPVALRFIRGQVVVTGYRDSEQGPASGLKIGDILTRLDGTPVAALVKQWSPYYGASNHAALLRDIANYMTRGNCGSTDVSIHRDAKELHLQVARVLFQRADYRPASHDLPGPTFRLLSPDIAYLKLSSVKAADAASYVTQAAGTRGLIIDIRNYPSEFMVFALGSLLVDHETPFARFTFGDLANPGGFHWMPPAPLSLTPAKPHYAGKVVILVDENTQSQAEFTTMAFRQAPGAVVVGSTTAGADGNISQIMLPGDFSTILTGLGVFYPNKRPTQRIGILPDVVVKPTLAGIRAGRDEVLERGLRVILGERVPEAELYKLYASPAPAQP